MSIEWPPHAVTARITSGFALSDMDSKRCEKEDEQSDDDKKEKEKTNCLNGAKA